MDKITVVTEERAVKILGGRMVTDIYLVDAEHKELYSTAYDMGELISKKSEALAAVKDLNKKRSAEAPKKNVKLSPKMQRVMDRLENAEHYYKVIGGDNRGGRVFHSSKGSLNIGYEPAWIYFDGMFGVTEDTKTLEALEKRGLIKIHEIGGNSCDVIEVIGKEVHEPLKTATKLRVTRKNVDRPEWGEQEFFEYMDSSITAEEVEKRYNERQGGFKWKVEVIGEVELTRWDYRKAVEL